MAAQADMVSPELQAKLNANATQPMQATGIGQQQQNDFREPDTSGIRKGHRARSMATINAALLAQQETPTAEKQANTGGVYTPHAAPPLDVDDPKHPELATDDRIPPPPWKATKEQKLEAQALTDAQETVLKAQGRLLGEQEAKRLREEQLALANRSQMRKAAERTLDNAKQVVHGADVRIGNVPKPTSIAVPLILLILFFFILIQYGGYSRLGWFWMVITQQAFVQDKPGQAGQVTPGTGEGPAVTKGNSQTSSLTTYIPPSSYSKNGLPGGLY